MRNIDSLKVGTAIGAILIPEFCRFLVAFQDSGELFENYWYLNPIAQYKECKLTASTIVSKSKRGENCYLLGCLLLLNISGLALGMLTPVTCYFAMTKPKSTTTIAPAILLCVVQSGLTYNWSRE